jgi:basic membrane lipoprotein Med (substrate-binding protein (PBP1-ABC) superfamily)
MNLRKYIPLVAVIHISALLMVACGSGRDEKTADGVFRVALLTPGPISDQAWNAAAYQGLERMRDSLGAEISHIQTKTPAEFEENFRQYGAKGYTLVIGHGFEFQDAAQRVGPEYPNTVFVTTGGTGTGPNIAALSFAFDEPSYLAGMEAAAISATGILGTIGGTELPPVAASFTAFEAGARAVRPDIKILGAYLGNWDDAGAGKEQALAQIARRADVIFQNADAAGLGIFQAVRETPGTWIVGSNADQNGIAPTSTLGSVVVDVPHAFLLLGREVKEGTFVPRVVRFDMASDAVRWVRNPAGPALPPAIVARVDSTNRLIRSHAMTLPTTVTP